MRSIISQRMTTPTGIMIYAGAVDAIRSESNRIYEDVVGKRVPARIASWNVLNMLWTLVRSHEGRG